MVQEFVDEIKKLIDDTLNGVHTAMPGTISGASGITATVKPSVTFKTADGKSMAYPSLSGCPIVMPMSADGQIGVAFPVKAGDACLIVCCESTLSQWQSGNYNSGLRFGLSNAICVPCLLKAAPAAVSKAKAKDAAILFCEQAEVLVGKDEIHAEYKKNVVPSFLFMGSIYPGVRDPHSFMDYLLKFNKPYKFIMMMRTPLEEKYVKESNGQIEYITGKGREDVVWECSKADFLINVTNPSMVQTPSKLIDYGIAGRPVLDVTNDFSDASAFLKFYEGDYSGERKVDFLDNYRIENVARLFVELAKNLL